MMPSTQLSLSVSPEQVITAVKQLDLPQREAFLEDLLAILSADYLDSISEARLDYQDGRIYSHEEVFS